MAGDERVPPDRAFDELVAIYEDAAAALRLSIAGALRSGSIASAAYRERQLAHVLAILGRLRVAGRQATIAGTRIAYSAAAVAVDKATALSGDFGGIHDRAVALLADNAAGRLDSAAELVGRRTGDAFRAAALRETGKGLAAGESRLTVSKALERRLVEEGVTDALTGFVDAAERRWGLDVYARMVARTTTREAVTRGTVNRLEEHGLDLVTVSDHGTDTELCQEFEGNTYSLSGDTPGYDVLEEEPPFHPNCQHVLTPAEASFADFERGLGLSGAEAEVL